MYKFVSHEWRPITGQCEHSCEYCLVGNTSILMSDYSVKNIKDIIIGDKVIGLKKGAQSEFSKFVISTVINTSQNIAKTIIIRTQDSDLEITPEHPILGSTEKRNCTDWKSAKSFSPYENIRFIGQPKLESRELMIGWLSGFCDGDGCFFIHTNKYNTKYEGFEAVCEDDALRTSFINICSRFGILMRESQKRSSTKSFNKGKTNKMVCNRQTLPVKKLKELILFSENQSDEFYKGYIAGMIDTDGSIFKSIRIFQSKTANKEKYERIRFCLHKLNIKYKEERNGFRLLGGFNLRMRLLMEFKIRHSIKSKNLLLWGSSVKGSTHSQIESMEKGKESVVYNLETDCGNYIANGFIVHNCYVTAVQNRYSHTQTPMKLHESELRYNLGKGNFIFVCSTFDLFSKSVPSDWIIRILAHCKDYPENKYLFQTKNPKRMYELKDFIPANSLLATTIETDKDYGLSKAPDVDERAYWIGKLSKDFETCVTIEPILSFTLEGLILLIKTAKPTFVNIGADSKHTKGLEEPCRAEVDALIIELKEFTEVRRKTNLERLK